MTELKPRELSVRWDRLAAGLGIAAVLVLGIVVLSRLGESGGGSTSNALRPQAVENGRAGGGAGRAPVTLNQSNTDYDPASLASLAQGLGARSASSLSGGPLPPPAPTPLPRSPQDAAQLPSKASASQALSCVERAAGLERETPVAYLEAASFQGIPTYIGAFRTASGARRYLVLVAATRSDCRALHVVSRRLPP